jgi:hypothetical protein
MVYYQPDPMRLLTAYFFALAVSWTFIACGPSAPHSRDQAAGVQQPLTSFRQVLTSSLDKLELTAGQDFRVPLRIENPGTETWESAGRYPVTISYKWYRDNQMLPIEGERTALPGPVTPNHAVSVDARVIAPPEAGTYSLRLTLVQEAVAWFMLRSNTFLALPAVVK